MSLNTISRIHSKGDYRYEEHVADAALSPGHLLEINSDNEVLKHNSASVDAEALFAMEDALQGSLVSTAYSAAEVVPCILPVKGSVVNAYLYAGTDYTVGTILESHGDGTLASGTTFPLAVVEDSECDLSASDAEDTLHPVRII